MLLLFSHLAGFLAAQSFGLAQEILLHLGLQEQLTRAVNILNIIFLYYFRCARVATGGGASRKPSGFWPRTRWNEKTCDRTSFGSQKKGNE